MNIIPWITAAAAIWFLFVGRLHGKKNATHGLMYQLCGVLIAVMTALVVWLKS
jgi:hypothetical protein